MSRYYQRPENALKRANEFIEVGKPARALDTLYEVIRSRKRAHTCSEKILEPIMFKYLELCVELKRSNFAKEGLFQYRNLCQLVNVSSLENVVRGYLTMAEERTDQAREKSQQAVIDIDDLDNVATPEKILLSAVSGEDAQDRTDRAILTPWVKFLWESYCQCLELLRTNSRVERLYHDIAQMTFRFCLKYSRKTEFRKLCDKLRKHLDDILKLVPGPMNINLNNPETQQLNLETRLIQLDSAIQMELWQEAYKAIEDINGLMALSKKPPQPKMMANYYQKLALVFWKANNFLFHAAALFKLINLSKEMKKNFTSDELQKMASRVLMSTLSVPLPSAHPEFDRFIETDKSPMEKAQRLAVLLGLPHPPTRASLTRDLIRYNVVPNAIPELQDLYTWLEVEFNPLKLCTRVHSVIVYVESNEELSYLAQYTSTLKDITLIRLVKQIAQVYHTITFQRLMELAYFTDNFHMERILVDAVRHNDMQIRINHLSNCINFGTDLSEAQREDLPEGPTLQAMPSETLRNQLIKMYSVLNKAVIAINPKQRKMDHDELKMKIVTAYHNTRIQEHQRILARHKIIEDRKEYLERLNTEREEVEARRQESLLRQQMLAEQKRLEGEREEREKKRKEDEFKQIQAKQMKEKVMHISQTSVGKRVFKNIDEEDLLKMDPDQIMARQVEELEKERQELHQKMKAQEKKVDYFERAKRTEEIQLIHKYVEDRQARDMDQWNQYEQERISLLVEERKLAVQHHERLIRMREDKEKFLEGLLNERQAVYNEKLASYEKIYNETRKKRLAERKEQRKNERRTKYYHEKEEEKKRKEEEEIERIRKEREEREEEESKRHKEIVDRQAQIQRQREKEIEEKIAREKDELRQQREDERGGLGGPRGGGKPFFEKQGESDWRSREDSRGGGSDRGADRPYQRPPIVAGSGKWREVEAAQNDKWAPPQKERESRYPQDSDFPGPPMRDRDGPKEVPPRDERRDLPPIRRTGGLEDGPTWRRPEKEPALPPEKEVVPPRRVPEEPPFDERPKDAPRNYGPPSDDVGQREPVEGISRSRDIASRDRDIPPRDRDIPPRDRDPPRERDLPPRERDFGRSDRDFGSGRSDRDFGSQNLDQGYTRTGLSSRPEYNRDRDFGGRSERNFGRSDRDLDDRPPGRRDFGGRDRDYGGPRDFGRDAPRDREYDRGGSRGGSTWNRDEQRGSTNDEGGSWRSGSTRERRYEEPRSAPPREDRPEQGGSWRDNKRRDDAPPRREDDPPRRDEGPPRRDDGPPARPQRPVEDSWAKVGKK